MSAIAYWASAPRTTLQKLEGELWCNPSLHREALVDLLTEWCQAAGIPL